MDAESFADYLDWKQTYLVDVCGWLKSIRINKLLGVVTCPHYKGEKMKQITKGHWVDEDYYEEANREYLAARNPFKWLKSLFKGKSKVAEVSKPKE